MIARKTIKSTRGLSATLKPHLLQLQSSKQGILHYALDCNLKEHKLRHNCDDFKEIEHRTRMKNQDRHYSSQKG